MKLLITGGAGFIGSAVIRYIIEHTQDSVVNVDKLTYAGNLESLEPVSIDKRYTFEKVDICNREELIRVFNHHQPDVVMHLAAESHVDRSIEGLISYLLSVIGASSEIANHKPDVLCINVSLTLSGLLKLFLITLELRSDKVVKIHVFFHGGLLSSAKLRAFGYVRILMRKALAPVTKFWFLTHDQEKQVCQLGFEGMTDRYRNYASCNDALYPSSEAETGAEDKINVLFVGRLVHEKGASFLVDALLSLPLGLQNRFFVKIVGDGPLSESIKEKLVDAQINNVSLTGRLSGHELDETYVWSDVFIFPTFHKEGFPYVYIESMRAGTPMLSTRAGALADEVVEGVNGWHLQAEMDAITDEIRERLIWLIDHEGQLKKMKQACYTAFEKSLTKQASESFYLTQVINGPEQSGLRKNRES